jgi:glycosyltransferase involved in cell wall biosynthesis
MIDAPRILWAHNFDPQHLNAGVFMGVLADAMAAEGMPITLHYMGNLRNPVKVVRAALHIRRMSDEFNIVHAQFGSACGLVVTAAGSRKVLSLRGSDLYRLKEGPLLHRGHGLAARAMTLASLSRYERVLVMSHRMHAEVSGHVDAGRVVVIPDGIDLDQFRPMPQLTAREALGCPQDRSPWVLFPTIFADNPIKRPWLALQAVEHARRKLPDLKLKVASGIAHTMMPTMINASSVILMTSTHEGWPNSVKEALACNVPFVTTDVSDLSAIANVEPSCSVADPDPVALGDAIVRAVQAERSETLRRHVLCMAHTAIARRVIDVYRALN